uniref:Mucin-5AC-like n=1 Tax=Phallusia mammillata TaxID=59560 RepID=A0A6F9DKW1_9ASCI|nr:mucin-5AC-like [Phallusia mammillata]
MLINGSTKSDKTYFCHVFQKLCWHGAVKLAASTFTLCHHSTHILVCKPLIVVSANLTCSSNDTSVENIACECLNTTTIKVDLNNNGVGLSIMKGNTYIGLFSGGLCCINKHDTNCTSVSNHATIDGDISCNNVSLTMLVYNVKENMNIYFVPGGPDTLVSTTNIMLTDCEGYCNLSGCINSGGYNTSSSFRCVKNTSLFVDGTMQTMSTFTCDACSSWVGNAECWYALLDVNPFYIESEVADFECVLLGNSTAYTTTEVKYFLDDKEVNSTTVMSSSNNNKTIWCSITVSGSTLKSNTSTLVVYWNHYSMIRVESSNYVVNATNGVLVNVNQDLTMYCLTDANPEASCQFYINNTLVHQSSCVYHQAIESSSLVGCSGQNMAGNQTSSNLTITVVEQRIPEVKSSHDPSGTIKKGDDISLTCDVPHSTELQTTYFWDTPATQHDIDEPSLILNNLTRFDLGYYTCHTNDLFESTQATVFINVTYGPETTAQNTTCKWSDAENGDCFVDFASNPLAQHYTLTDNGNPVLCTSCTFQQHTSDSTVQRFVLSVEKSDRDATLILNVFSTSPDFPEPMTVNFIISQDDVPQNSNHTVAIAASVSAIALTFVIILVAIIVVRRKRQPKQPECDGPTHNANVYVNEEFDQDGNSFSTDGCKDYDEGIPSKDVASPDGHFYDEEIRSTHSVNSPIYGYDNEPLYDDVPKHDAISAYETTIIGKSDGPYEDCNCLK